MNTSILITIITVVLVCTHMYLYCKLQGSFIIKEYKSTRVQELNFFFKYFIYIINN